MGGGAGTSGDDHVGLSHPHVFNLPYFTASDGKLGGGLGTRLMHSMACVYGLGLYVCGLAISQFL